MSDHTERLAAIRARADAATDRPCIACQTGDTATTHDRHRAAKAIQAVRATYVEDIARANQAIWGAADPDVAEALRRARTILVGISAGLDRAAARLIEEES